MTLLKGIRALVTRPQPQANQLAGAIVERQGLAWVMPMMDIIPLPETQNQRDTILNLDQYHKIIITSRPAAIFGLELLERYWPQFPLHLEWFAIGQSTAGEMTEYLIQPTYPQSTDPERIADSEALLEMTGLQDIESQKILIIKGQGGRELLPKELQARGAAVATLEVYQRQRPVYPMVEVVKQLESNDINVILCGSGETVTHLAHYLPEPSRTGAVLIVPGERVARHARALGFRQVLNACGASHHAMLSALEACRANLIQINPEDPL